MWSDLSVTVPRHDHALTLDRLPTSKQTITSFFGKLHRKIMAGFRKGDAWLAPSRKGDQVCELVVPCILDAVRQQHDPLGLERFDRSFIVGDQDNRTLIRPQGGKNLATAGRVQVVSRLVEQ